MLKLIIFFFAAYLSFLCLFSSSDYPEKIHHGSLFPYLADKPVSEDGFYMLTVARNISKGDFFEYNHNIITTGVQPLATLMYGGIYELASIFTYDRIEQLRFIIFFSGLLVLGFFLLLFKLFRILYPSINCDFLTAVAAIFSILNFDLFIKFTNGLETGLYLVLILTSILFSYRYLRSQKGLKLSLFLGFIFGLTILARIDFLLPLAVILGFYLIKRYINLKQFMQIAVTTALVVSPWIYFTYKTTNRLVQSSASSQTSLINLSNLPSRASDWFLALAETITVNIYFGNKKSVLLIAAFILIFILFWLILQNRTKVKLFIKSNPNLIVWFIAITTLVIIYPVYSSAPYFYYRYFSPLIIPLLLFIPFIYSLIKERFEFQFPKKSLSVLFIIFFLVQGYFYFHSGNLALSYTLRIKYIKENFDINENIGCFQSGVAGYFNSNVYNLDGKIDHRALSYLRKAKIERYVNKNDIIALIEWKYLMENIIANNDLTNWKLYENDIGDGRTAVYVREGYRAK